MKRILLSILALGASLAVSAQVFRCADPEATPEARALLERLVKIRDKGIMYGHQDELLKAMKADGHYLFYEDIKRIK
ncbi:MAG: hypothetical protein J6N50_10580 [Bacteroidales bacterium]|nr:hypothetical protein [Bacteroidales bacterium]